MKILWIFPEHSANFRRIFLWIFSAYFKNNHRRSLNIPRIFNEHFSNIPANIWRTFLWTSLINIQKLIENHPNILWIFKELSSNISENTRRTFLRTFCERFTNILWTFCEHLINISVKIFEIIWETSANFYWTCQQIFFRQCLTFYEHFCEQSPNF